MLVLDELFIDTTVENFKSFGQYIIQSLKAIACAH